MGHEEDFCDEIECYIRILYIQILIIPNDQWCIFMKIYKTTTTTTTTTDKNFLAIEMLYLLNEHVHFDRSHKMD
jgi:hypothetical protein